MKIYVSDKEIDNNNLNYVVEDWYEEYWLLKGNKEENGFEIHDDVGLVKIQSLEQHEAEIRKQECQKVLDELLEWVEQNTVNPTSARQLEYITVYGLKQKLNEMKGEE